MHSFYLVPETENQSLYLGYMLDLAKLKDKDLIDEYNSHVDVFCKINRIMIYKLAIKNEILKRQYNLDLIGGPQELNFNYVLFVKDKTLHDITEFSLGEVEELIVKYKNCSSKSNIVAKSLVVYYDKEMVIYYDPIQDSIQRISPNLVITEPILVKQL